MLKILRYLILISLISSGYYLFISEFFHLSEKDFLETEIVKKEKVEDKKEIIKEKKEEVVSSNIKKSIDKVQYVENKIKILKGDTFVSILESLNFEQENIYEIISEIENFFDLKKIKLDILKF